MKKILTVLAILTLIVGAVFAEGAEGEKTTPTATKSRVTIESTVEEKQPAFVLKAGLKDTNEESANFGKVTYGTTGKSVGESAEETFDGTVLKTGIPSIADSDIEVYFQIMQTGSAGLETDSGKKFARYKKVVNFNVKVGDLICDQQDGTKYRISGEASESKAADDIANPNKDNVYTLKNFASANHQNYSATYNGKVYDDQEIATFKATWEKDNYAPNGTYKADITLTYTIS